MNVSKVIVLDDVYIFSIRIFQSCTGGPKLFEGKKATIIVIQIYGKFEVMNQKNPVHLIMIFRGLNNALCNVWKFL